MEINYQQYPYTQTHNYYHHHVDNPFPTQNNMMNDHPEMNINGYVMNGPNYAIGNNHYDQQDLFINHGGQDMNNTISVDDYDYSKNSEGLQDQIINSVGDDDEYLKKLPIGYRFMPNDNELIYYLRKKVNNEALPSNRIRTIDLYQFSPHDLTDILGRNEEGEWYLFTRLKWKNKGAKYANRTTPNGYWKATSGDNHIRNRGEEEVGTRKALVYYEGKSSKTDWIMHEYRLIDHSKVADNLVLCRIHNNHNKNA